MLRPPTPNGEDASPQATEQMVATDDRRHSGSDSVAKHKLQSRVDALRARIKTAEHSDVAVPREVFAVVPPWGENGVLECQAVCPFRLAYNRSPWIEAHKFSIWRGGDRSSSDARAQWAQQQRIHRASQTDAYGRTCSVKAWPEHGPHPLPGTRAELQKMVQELEKLENCPTGLRSNHSS